MGDAHSLHGIVDMVKEVVECNLGFLFFPP